MRILIVGATSAIASETARCFARDGAVLALAARNPDRVAAVAADLRGHGAKQVAELVFDAANFDTHETMIASAVEALGRIDAALIAYGTLPDPSVVHTSPDATVEAFHLNATSVISILARLADLFEQQQSGTLAVISSVAGERGRKSNYVYGAAKGAVSLFAQGLRARLKAVGVRVITIKPGFVDTPMTAHIPKNALFASPQQIGKTIHKAMTRGADVVYAPAFWRPIMIGIRAIPERVFKRMDL